MADEIVKQESAMGAHHNYLMIGGRENTAVVFNRDASVESLLSFAHGQIAILDTMLSSAGGSKTELDLDDFADAVRSIIKPALHAIELANVRAHAITAPQRF